MDSVCEAKLLVRTEFLDAGKHVVPTADVQAGGVLTQFPQHLIHFERRKHGLDQDSAFDRTLRHAQFVLRHHEDVVPQPRLEVRFQLGQIEIRAATALEQLFGAMEKVKPEIEDAAGDLLAVDQHVLLVQMPAARSRHQYRGLVVQFVFLSFLVKSDGAAHRIAQVDLTVDHVVPSRRIGVFEVGHEYGAAAVERVDHHLAIGGTGDFNPTVEHVGGLRRDLPFGTADARRLR